MFETKWKIFLCILIGICIGWYFAIQFYHANLEHLPDRKGWYVVKSVKVVCYVLVYLSAIVGAILGSWRHRSFLFLAISGITIGFFFLGYFSPALSSRNDSIYIPAEIILERLPYFVIGASLGSGLFLCWPLISKFINTHYKMIFRSND